MTTTIDKGILDIAEQLKPEMQVGDAGIVTISKDTYEKFLPEGLSMDVIKQVQAHNAKFLAGAGKALGDAGIEAFQKDKNLDQVSFELPVHKDTVSGTFSRSKQVPDGNGGQQTKYGVLGMKWNVSGAAGSRGELKKVRTHLSEMAKEALAE